MQEVKWTPAGVKGAFGEVYYQINGEGKVTLAEEQDYRYLCDVSSAGFSAFCEKIKSAQEERN